LRNVGAATIVNELLFRGFNDSDVRVRIKAIDVLGARGTNDAVALMAQSLFLRQTPPVEKLHLVAALGRIGDSRGALPVIQYLKQTDDTASRGTAIFALGEIGDPVANDLLIQAVSADSSPLVRKLAQEAIEKIDGELPNHHQQQLAAEKVKALQPADQKLSKLRQMDQMIQNSQY
jgi:HEAT repeat protein